jgi:hypothetical protein
VPFEPSLHGERLRRNWRRGRGPNRRRKAACSDSWTWIASRRRTAPLLAVSVGCMVSRALQEGFVDLADVRSCVKYPASDWSVLCSGPPWISAHICAGSSSSLAPTIIKCGFIDRWTRMLLLIGRSCTSAPSHHDLFSAACITTIAESEFSTHTMVERRDLGQGARQLQERHGLRWVRERRPYASQMTPLAVIDAKPLVLCALRLCPHRSGAA